MSEDLKRDVRKNTIWRKIIMGIFFIVVIVIFFLWLESMGFVMIPALVE